MSKYSCSKCGLAVIVLDNEVITACNCNAPIIGQMSSRLEGKGKVVA